MTVSVSTLDNGLRVVTDPVDSVESVSIGVWVGTGTRSESAANNGVAHFLEHMAFKGTERRSALQIAEEIENVGGHINAYTSRESTAYFVKLLKEDAALGVDILSDILQHPSFDGEELERERSVILQEIGQAYDTPDDVIYDHFQETAFAGQAMGLPTLGSPATVGGMKRGQLVDFMAQGYRAGNMVLAASGKIEHDRLVALAEKSFGTLPLGEAADRPAAPLYRRALPGTPGQRAGAPAVRISRDRGGPGGTLRGLPVVGPVRGRHVVPPVPGSA